MKYFESIIIFLVCIFINYQHAYGLSNPSTNHQPIAIKLMPTTNDRHNITTENKSLNESLLQQSEPKAKTTKQTTATKKSSTLPMATTPAQAVFEVKQQSNREMMVNDGNKITVVIKSGDTLRVIAKHYGVSVKQIVAWNDIADANKIKAGNSLVIYSNQK